MNHYFKISKSGFISLFIVLITVGQTKAQEDVITYDIGSFAVTLLSEGQQQGNKSILVDATEEMLKETIPNGTFPSAVNAFLVETENKTILFDTGFGRKLFDNLERIGKTTADIDVIMLTHMHGDHIGGLLKDDKKSFPNAMLYIPQPEYDYWMNDEIMQSIPENRRGSFTQARKAIEAYKNNLQLFIPNELESITSEVFPGIRGIAAYGHTPGHTAYLLNSDNSQFMIWGDLTHVTPIQMDYPQVAVTYDVDPAKAVESRQQIFKYLADNKIDIAGMHIQYPGLGTVSKNKSDGYIFKLTCDCEGMER